MNANWIWQILSFKMFENHEDQKKMRKTRKICVAASPITVAAVWLTFLLLIAHCTTNCTNLHLLISFFAFLYFLYFCNCIFNLLLLIGYCTTNRTSLHLLPLTFFLIFTLISFKRLKGSPFSAFFSQWNLSRDLNFDFSSVPAFFTRYWKFQHILLLSKLWIAQPSQLRLFPLLSGFNVFKATKSTLQCNAIYSSILIIKIWYSEGGI